MSRDDVELMWTTSRPARALWIEIEIKLEEMPEILVEAREGLVD